MARNAKKETGANNLVLAGGVALNCVANGKLEKQNLFDGIWIQPAAGDAGGALGAALLVSHKYFNVPRTINKSKRDRQKGSYLGAKYSTSEVKAYLDRNNYPYKCIIDKNARIGDDVRINGGDHLKDTDTETYTIRDGIVVIKSKAVIANGTVI